MKKIFGALHNREGRKGLICFLYRFIVAILTIIFVILPVLAAVVMTILVIIDKLPPISMVIWPSILFGLLIYFLFFALLTINYGFYLDNVEIAQKYVEATPEEKPSQEVSKNDKEVKQPEAKKYKLVRPYRIANANNAVVAANTEVEYHGEQNGKAKIGCSINGKKYFILVLPSDVQLM